MFGNLFGGLILGNAEGFTLADGRKIEKQKVEKIKTVELGYRGKMANSRLFFDANAYYNISQDFLSPAVVLGVAAQRGDTPMNQVQSAFAVYNGLVASYINFGEVNTFGADLGLTYFLNPKLSATLNYSYFDYSVDETDLSNDIDKNGEVNFLDLLVNAPTHKGGMGLNYSDTKWFGSVYARWVQKYNYFSSFQIASETLVKPDGTPYIYRGRPIVENARSGDAYNYGPLGGFVTVDLALGYRLNDKFTLSAAASNLFNQTLREFTASAPTKGLYTLEMRVNLPALGKK
jgi:iron complex outermembrane receptor protein